MLHVCASLSTCVQVTHHRCNRPQKLNSLSRQVQCDRTPSASTFRSVPNSLHSNCGRPVSLRRRHVIQNAGGPAGGVTKSKGGKGKEVSASCAWAYSQAKYLSFWLTSRLPQAYIVLCLHQVDTLGKKLLVGVAFGYLALVLVVPTLNVFVQVCARHTLQIEI